MSKVKATLLEQFLKLSLKRKTKMLCKLNSEELAGLHELLHNYVKINGINVGLQRWPGIIFELEQLRDIEKQNPGLILINKSLRIGYDHELKN